MRVELRDEIRRIQLELGITTVFVTHDQEEALSMADRVGVMRRAGIEQTATPTEMYAGPATPFVAEFVGISSRVPGRVDGETVDVLGRTASRGARWQRGTPLGALVDVLLRPENLTVCHDPGGPGQVVSKSFLGSVSRVVVRLDAQTQVKIDVVGLGAAGFGAGDPVRVGVEGVPVMIANPVGRKLSDEPGGQSWVAGSSAPSTRGRAISRGWQVTHLEREAAPRGASVRNFGLIWVSGRAAGDELRLALGARGLWDEVAADCPGTGFRAVGSLTVAAHDHELTALEAAAKVSDAAERGFATPSWPTRLAGAPPPWRPRGSRSAVVRT